MKKNILFITTGGTIAQTVTEGTLKIDPLKKGNYLLHQIVYQYEELNVNKIDVCDLFQLDSSYITPFHWKNIIDKIVEQYEQYDAFILLHGTDTLSYTCAALSYAFSNIDKPIIVTGAQIPMGSMGSDAELNLENAIRVATQDITRLKGVVAVFGSHIITGTRVRKTSEFHYDAFESFRVLELGNIGTKIQFNQEQVNNHNNYYGDAKTSKELKIMANYAMDKIMVINEFPGLNGRYLEALIEVGVKGFILRAYAGGNSNVKQQNGEDSIAGVYNEMRKRHIPLVVISQPTQGNTTMDVYQPSIIARSLGGIPALDITTEALTVKLGWIIGQDLTYKEIQNYLSTNIRGEITTKTR